MRLRHFFSSKLPFFGTHLAESDDLPLLLFESKFDHPRRRRGIFLGMWSFYKGEVARNTVDVEEFVSYFPHFRGVFQLYNDVYLKKNSALRAEF